MRKNLLDFSVLICGSITSGTTVTFKFAVGHYFAYANSQTSIIPKEVAAILSTVKTITWSSDLPAHSEYPPSRYWKLTLSGAISQVINYNATGTISNFNDNTDLSINFAFGAANGGGCHSYTVNFHF